MLSKWRKRQPAEAESGGVTSDQESGDRKFAKWSLGVLNDKETDEVPGKRALPSSCWQFH